MVTRNFIRGTSLPGGVGSNVQTIVVQSELAADLDISCPVGTTGPITFPVDVSQLRGLHITADGDLVLKTNSSGSPANTITLLANQPLQWLPADGALRDTADAAITVDIATLYAINSGAAAVQLTINALVDPTP